MQRMQILQELRKIKSTTLDDSTPGVDLMPRWAGLAPVHELPPGGRRSLSVGDRP